MDAGGIDLLPTREVKKRLGDVTDMTLWRWLRNPEVGFPPPVVISKRKYWPAAEIEAFIARRRAA